MSLPFTDNVKILNDVTTTTTSAGYDVSKRQQITVQFIASGTSTFSIDGSNDGTNWFAMAFQNASSTTPTTLITDSVVTATNVGVVVTPGFRFIRVAANVSSGTATAIIEAAG